MKLTEDNLYPFDWEEELLAFEERVGQILDRYNPAHQNTRAYIANVAAELLRKVEEAWSERYVDQGLRDAKATSSTLLAGMLGMSEVARRRDNPEENIGAETRQLLTELLSENQK